MNRTQHHLSKWNNKNGFGKIFAVVEWKRYKYGGGLYQLTTNKRDTVQS